MLIAVRLTDNSGNPLSKANVAFFRPGVSTSKYSNAFSAGCTDKDGYIIVDVDPGVTYSFTSSSATVPKGSFTAPFDTDRYVVNPSNANPAGGGGGGGGGSVASTGALAFYETFYSGAAAYPFNPTSAPWSSAGKKLVSGANLTSDLTTSGLSFVHGTATAHDDGNDAGTPDILRVTFPTAPSGVDAWALEVDAGMIAKMGTAGQPVGAMIVVDPNATFTFESFGSDPGTNAGTPTEAFTRLRALVPVAVASVDLAFGYNGGISLGAAFSIYGSVRVFSYKLASGQTF